MNRRTTLLRLAAACGTALTYAALSGCAKNDPVTPAVDAAKPAGDADLQEDLARMAAPREDSEVGVPVIIACVDVAARKAGKAGAPANAFSAQFAADLRRYGDAWQRLHADAKEADVARLIQILAERDFRGVKGVAA